MVISNSCVKLPIKNSDVPIKNGDLQLKKYIVIFPSKFYGLPGWVHWFTMFIRFQPSIHGASLVLPKMSELGARSHETSWVWICVHLKNML